jgi:hypothetical protein
VRHSFHLFPSSALSQFGNIPPEPHEKSKRWLQVHDRWATAPLFSREGRTMTSDDKSASERDPKFSFAVRELRDAQSAQPSNAETITLEISPGKATGETRGFDPYNTSGSFDRKKNWSRVGKR